jgi:hypothetical protein
LLSGAFVNRFSYIQQFEISAILDLDAHPFAPADLPELTDFAAISESDAQKPRKTIPAGTHHD